MIGTRPAGRSDRCSELLDLARLAYIYGFPAYELARLRVQAFSRSEDEETARPNLFNHARHLTRPTTGRITNTNADMLKSSAWLDLARGPLVIHVPECAGRYYSLALMDAFTNNFAVIGRRCAGAAARDLWLAGPGDDAAPPPGMTPLRAPTNWVWALVRILVQGPDDLAEVRTLQDRFTISAPAGPGFAAARSAPAAAWRLPFDDAKPLRFFEVLNAVLSENPPPPADEPVLARLRQIGVGPALRFDRRGFTEQELAALRQGLASARQALRAKVGPRLQDPRPSPPRSWLSDTLLAQLRGPGGDARTRPGRLMRPTGWSRPAPAVGNFGTHYLLRARCALRGIGGLPREEAMYFIAATDAQGAAFDGGNRYTLRFDPGAWPPVDAYWSLTAYFVDETNRRWLAPNPIDRYSLASHSAALHPARDGSLEIVIQHERPVESDANWLPAPLGRFVLTLRAYEPRPQLLDEGYDIPDVERCGASA